MAVRAALLCKRIVLSVDRPTEPGVPNPARVAMSPFSKHEPTPTTVAAKRSQRLHPDILKLGLVSFLTDLSSEMIFSVFAIFFTTVAGASSALLGLIEGLADFAAASLNYLAGWLSDRSGKRKTFAIAVVPAVLSVLVLARIKDRPGACHQHESVSRNWRLLTPEFKRSLIPAGLFALAYFSLGFVLLRAHELGFDVAAVVLLYALFNISCVCCALLVGMLGDRIGRSYTIAIGYGIYAGINVCLMFANSRWQILALLVVLDPAAQFRMQPSP